MASRRVSRRTLPPKPECRGFLKPRLAKPHGSRRAVGAHLTMRLMRKRVKEVQTLPRPKGHAQHGVPKGVTAHPATDAAVSGPHSPLDENESRTYNATPSRTCVI